MIPSATRTGASLGDFDEISAYEPDAVARRTPAAPIDNPTLATVLRNFDRVRPNPMAALNGFWGLHAAAADPDMAVFIDNLAEGGPEAYERIAQLNVQAELGSVHGYTIMFSAGGTDIDIDIVAPCLWADVPHGLPAGTRMMLGAIGGFGGQRESAHASAQDEMLEAVDGGDDAVAVVSRLAKLFGLPKRDVLRAAGVNRSSYYLWRRPDGPKPRVASLGRLWGLAQLAEDLTEVLSGPVSPWLLANVRRRKSLLAGHFDELLGDAVDYRSRRLGVDDSDLDVSSPVGSDRDDPAGLDHSASTAVDFPVDGGPRREPPIRPVTRVQPRSSKDRRPR